MTLAVLQTHTQKHILTETERVDTRNILSLSPSLCVFLLLQQVFAFRVKPWFHDGWPDGHSCRRCITSQSLLCNPKFRHLPLLAGPCWPSENFSSQFTWVLHNIRFALWNSSSLEWTWTTEKFNACSTDWFTRMNFTKKEKNEWGQFYLSWYFTLNQKFALLFFAFHFAFISSLLHLSEMLFLLYFFTWKTYFITEFL